MDAELPAGIAAEDEKVREAWLWAEAFLAKPFARFQQWLAKNQIDVVPQRVERRNTIYKRMASQGLWAAWQTKKGEILEEWAKWPEAKNPPNKKSWFSPRLRNELLWRLSEVMIVNVSSEIVERRDSIVSGPVTADDVKGMEFLPDWMRWAVHHPCLIHPKGVEKDDPVLLESKRRYEAAFPCPNQGAMNMFTFYRGDDKKLDAFYKHLMSLYAAEVKRAGNKPDNPEDEEVAENLEHLASLEEMLGVK